MTESVSTLSRSESPEELQNERMNHRQPESRTRDNWDKVDIILRFVGAFTTAAVLAAVGIVGSLFLADRQAKDTNFRLYTELMSRREESDTSLRKEMFSPILTDFLKPSFNAEPEKMVLNLELLAYNFHDSLDLKPLFKEVYEKLNDKKEQNLAYVERLTRVRRDVIDKQVAMLAEAGGKRDGTVSIESLEEQPGGVTVLDDVIEMNSTESDKPILKQVRIEVLSANPRTQELRVRLIVRGSPEDDDVDADFTLGLFDFPMVDNLRLPHGLRCAIVINSIDLDSAEFTFLYFPGARASFKETEVLYNLRKPTAP